MGRALGENRESVFLATKIFPVLPVAPVVEQRAVASVNRLESDVEEVVTGRLSVGAIRLVEGLLARDLMSDD